MTKAQFHNRLDTLCAKAEALQSLASDHNVSREVSEALAAAKNASLRAMREFEKENKF